MLEVFGVVFVEEVLDADIETLIAERQKRGLRKILREQMKFAMNWLRKESSSWIQKKV